MLAKRGIPAGEVITGDLLYSPLLVHKGETVTVKASKWNLNYRNDARQGIGAYGRNNLRRAPFRCRLHFRPGDRTTIARDHWRNKMNTLILSLMLLQNPAPASQAPSLFSANAPDLFLYRDVKARNVGDILTIQVIESASATNSATTATQKKGDVSLSAPALAGLETINTPLNFSNVLQAAGGLNFNGTGSTTRSGQLQAAISARVVQVLPNGDLRIEGTKVVTINGERQTLTIGGMVRSHDVSPIERHPVHRDCKHGCEVRWQGRRCGFQQAWLVLQALLDHQPLLSPSGNTHEHEETISCSGADPGSFNSGSCPDPDQGHRTHLRSSREHSGGIRSRHGSQQDRRQKADAVSPADPGQHAGAIRTDLERQYPG